MVFDNLVDAFRMEEEDFQEDLYTERIPGKKESKQDVWEFTHTGDGCSEGRLVSKGVEYENIPKYTRRLATGITGKKMDKILTRRGTEVTTVLDEEFEPLTLAKSTLLFFALVVSAAYSSIKGYSLGVQMGLYLTALAVFVWFDSVGMFRNVLARQSRYLVAFLIGLYATEFFVLSPGFIVVVVVSTVFVFGLVLGMNGKWLREYHFCMNPVIHQTLNNNADTAAFEAWTYSGERDCRTLARYNRNSMESKVVDSLYRGFWTLGYNTAYKSVSQLKKALTDAQKETNEALQKHEKALGELLECRQEMKALEIQLDEMREKYSQEIMQHSKTFQQMQDVAAVNEQLVEEIEELEAEATPEETPKEMAKRLFMENIELTVVKVCEITGLSNGTAGRIKKEVKEELANRKIIDLQQATA